MELTFEQQNAYLDNVASMDAKATELENETTELYARVESMARELQHIKDDKVFAIKFRAYEALLHEADISANAATIARSMARTAIVKFVDEVEITTFH
jgi:hypothetical protein